MSISSSLVDCLKRFNTLTSRDELASYASEVPINSWADELGRLRVWAANIGAHQTGQSSLDYRLRDASHIKAQTIRLLQRLRRTLEDSEDFLTENVEDEDDLSIDDEEQTELQQINHALINTIDCLFELSMIIRRPAQHDRLLGTKKLDATIYEPFDVSRSSSRTLFPQFPQILTLLQRQHVAHKHPKAGNLVVDRLGAAISRRRAALKYRERHRAKLEKGIESVVDESHDRKTSGDPSEHGDAVSTRLSETIATAYEEPHIDFEDAASLSGASQTSYAQSLWENNQNITIPRPPKESADGKPFECPYCFFILTVQNKRSWTRHVFKDLMPYVCVFPDCGSPNQLYDSRRNWFHHLRTEHFSSSDTIESRPCPLSCGDTVPFVLFERHVGRHLEELALFALPRLDDAHDEDSNQSQRSLNPGHDWEEISSTSSEEATSNPQLSSADIVESGDPDQSIQDSSLRELGKSKKLHEPGQHSFTHEQLMDLGTITKSHVPENQRAKVYFIFRKPLPDVFIISLHYTGKLDIFQN